MHSSVHWLLSFIRQETCLYNRNDLFRQPLSPSKGQRFHLDLYKDEAINIPQPGCNIVFMFMVRSEAVHMMHVSPPHFNETTNSPVQKIWFIASLPPTSGLIILKHYCMNIHKWNVSMADLRATGNVILKAPFLSQFKTWLNPCTQAVTTNPADTQRLTAEVIALPPTPVWNSHYSHFHASFPTNLTYRLRLVNSSHAQLSALQFSDKRANEKQRRGLIDTCRMFYVQFINFLVMSQQCPIRRVGRGISADTFLNCFI